MEHIEYTRTGAVAQITLNRPQKLNALFGSMREDLLMALQDAERCEGVRAVVITGAGRGFCAGGDVRYMSRLRGENDLSDFSRILDAANAVARTLYLYSKPLVAAVNGPAAGGGANLALACDLRIGSTSCSFTQSFIKIGLGPDWGGSFLLPRIVGVDRARELLLSGRTVESREALALGLIHRLVEPEELSDAAREGAQALADASPHAVRAIKAALRCAPVTGIDAALEHERSAQMRCFMTAEAGTAFAAFGKARRRQR